MWHSPQSVRHFVRPARYCSLRTCRTCSRPRRAGEYGPFGRSPSAMPMAAIAVAATADERCGPAGGRRAVVILDDAAGHDQIRPLLPVTGALKPGHQRLFRRLGVSPCACLSLPAAAALGGCTLAEAEKALVTLLDCHLLARAPGGQFRFHDLIRGYAAVRAARDDPEAGQRQAVGKLLYY